MNCFKPCLAACSLLVPPIRSSILPERSRISIMSTLSRINRAKTSLSQRLHDTIAPAKEYAWHQRAPHAAARGIDNGHRGRGTLPLVTRPTCERVATVHAKLLSGRIQHATVSAGSPTSRLSYIVLTVPTSASTGVGTGLLPSVV